MKLEVGEYHAKEGWTFKREGSRVVRIRKYAHDGRSDDVEHEIHLDLETWCSAVASVSPEGENGVTFDFMRCFHTLVGFAVRAVPAPEGARE